MTRDLKTSKRPSKALAFSKQHPARARRKGRSQGKDKVRAIDDVYEYAPSKVRRANVALSLDRHEIEGRRYGSDDEIDLSGLGPDAMQKLRARLMQDDGDGNAERNGEQVDSEDDEEIDSEDDEEIDSDDAFEESDKEQFAGSSFVRKGIHTTGARRNRASNKNRPVVKEVDLNEDSGGQSVDSQSASEDKEDEDEVTETDEESAGEYFDVLDVFDGRAEVEDDDHSPPNLDRKVQDVHTLSKDEMEWEGTGDADVMSGDENSREEVEGKGKDDDEEEEEEEDSAVDEDDELRISASDTEDHSPEALADLKTFLSNLDSAAPHKRKSIDEVKELSSKRQRIADRTEAGEENEFGVRGTSTLKLDDLLAPLASSSASLVALKKSTKVLMSSNPKTKTLSAPLPQRAQERLDREAAYEQTKVEVDKWSATMKRIKEAEHLSFPLQAEKPSRVSNLELAAKFTPSNELESAVDKLLKSAQLRDEDIAHTEALKMAHLTVEEVAARRAELRTMRELAFRADRKAKRIAKIKSKAYRRIRKKQRERLDGAVEDGDGGEEDDEEARLKADVQRARERATLKHKNTGKWAKTMKGREGLDQDQRQAIGEMLERGEKLRRRIRGENSGDEESEDDESDGEDQDEEAIKRGVFEELDALRTEDDANLPDLKSKSVFDMKFMRDAAARQSREADAQSEEFQREMRFGIGREEDNDDGTDPITGAPPADTTMVQRTGGRLSFRPGIMPSILRSLGSLASDTSSVTLQSADLMQDVPFPSPTPTSSVPTPVSALVSAPISNPWLVPTAPSGPSRKRDEVRVHKDADASTKSSNKLKKQAEKHHEERERARDDAVLEIDADNVLTIPDPPAPSAPEQKNKKKRKGASKLSSGPMSTTCDEGDNSDVASEIEEQERAVERNKGGKGVRAAFQQRELVALAFAGDNVVQAFEDAKRQETEADAPREVDTTLPGWGAWGGTGTQKRPPKSHLIKSVPGIAPAARADHAKPHLIISEKRDKKAAKFLVRELPHPYTSHAQFERRMETPLGSEWNTRVGFQRGTLPRVVKKMGTVIDPLEKLF